MKETLLSVGIDIGTSTTQLVFSKLLVENVASSYSVPRVVIMDKEIIYRSAIYFTPLTSPTTIDGVKVRDLIEQEYQKAGIAKSEIDTGAVIITGETARKENAKEVLETLSGFAGDFVVATAGPDLESIIAGKGAGANTWSKQHRKTVVNMDIGGGTSNLALFRDGEVVDTGCLDVGGRLIKVDKQTHEITYLSAKVQQWIQKHGLALSVGMTATVENVKPVIDAMVHALMQSVGLAPMDEDFSIFVTNKSIEIPEDIDNNSVNNINEVKVNTIEAISFSGGVADCIYRSMNIKNSIAQSSNEAVDDFYYGDVGILLGRAIAESPLCRQLEVVRSIETIRATVVGAGTHTTEISGSTITYTQDVFPIKNMPILKLSREDEKNANTLAKAIEKKLNWFRLENDIQRVALAIEGIENPSFTQVEEYAKGLALGMKELIARELPLVIIVEKDMAKALGQTLYMQLQAVKDVICLDSISLDNGDYIDVGKPIAEGYVLPVVVKTLVFNS